MHKDGDVYVPHSKKTRPLSATPWLESAKEYARHTLIQNVLQHLVACRLMALDKYSGVRPIGIGEVVQCIIGKAILTTIGEEIQEAAGALQICAGHQAGSEAAIHAMRRLKTPARKQLVSGCLEKLP